MFGNFTKALTAWAGTSTVVFVDLAVSNNLWFDDSLVTRSVHIYTYTYSESKQWETEVLTGDSSMPEYNSLDTSS